MNILKNINIKLISVFSLALGVSALFSLGLAPSVNAASKTWIGTACEDSVFDCNWSNHANWSGGAIPVSGDSVIFNIKEGSINNIENDIDNLVVTGIIIDGENYISKLILGDITLAGDIINKTNKRLNIEGNITLGSDVSVSSGSLAFGNTYIIDSDNNQKINLNGYKLTFQDDHIGNRGDYEVYSKITGAGNIVLDSPGKSDVLPGSLTLYADNDYTGKTDILNGEAFVFVFEGTPFGASSIYVANNYGANIRFNGFTKSATILNNIVVQGSQDLSSLVWSSLSFSRENGDDSIIISLPNVTILGNVTFENSNFEANSLVVDLDGIKTNGYCLGYMSNDSANNYGGFINGPDFCRMDLTDAAKKDLETAPVAAPTVKPAIKAPDTAMSSFKMSNPFAAIVLGSISVFSVIFVARKQIQKK